MTQPAAVLQSLEEAAQRREVPASLLKAAFDEIMSGQASESQVAGLLVALRVKGETVSEIVATAQALRSAATMARAADPRTVDTCGTGGDKKNTLNISTATAILSSACGLKIAKHGNKSVSSKSGSSEVLEKLGVNINTPVKNSEKLLKNIESTPMFELNIRRIME